MVAVERVRVIWWRYPDFVPVDHARAVPMGHLNLAFVRRGSLIRSLAPVRLAPSAVGPRRTRNRRAHDHGTWNKDHR